MEIQFTVLGKYGKMINITLYNNLKKLEFLGKTKNLI